MDSELHLRAVNQQSILAQPPHTAQISPIAIFLIFSDADPYHSYYRSPCIVFSRSRPSISSLDNKHTYICTYIIFKVGKLDVVIVE